MTDDDLDISGQPWPFDEAVAIAHKASKFQMQVEDEVRKAYTAHAHAEENYRLALASRIVELRAEGAAAILARDLARGDPRIAELKREEEIADGLKESAKQASWRRAADRRDVEGFTAWSMRRDLAEGRG